jgi:hypothetical protein
LVPCAFGCPAPLARQVCAPTLAATDEQGDAVHFGGMMENVVDDAGHAGAYGQQDFDSPSGPGLDRLLLIAVGARSSSCKLKSSLEVDPVEARPRTLWMRMLVTTGGASL